MPKVEDGPEELNALLENVYNECMATKKNKKRCSMIAWGAAEKAGWNKNSKGEWKKKSTEELKKDELAKKCGIKRNKKMMR